MTIAAILGAKGRDVVRVAPTDSIAQVAETLSLHKVGAVLVLDPSAPKAGARIDQIAGIISERDIVRALIAAHSTGDVLDMAAASVMTEIRATIGLSASVRDAAILMTDRRVRHLPVIEDDVLVGLVSIGDVVKARLEQQETEVESLRAYVVGAG
jgi:CBS domain-containing protein